MSDAGIVIVGAGEAGARAAGALRENRYAGPVTLIGDEPHHPYERPPLSKAAMVAEEAPLPTTILDEERLAAQAITHIGHARAARIDPAAHRLTLEDGRRLPYSKLLIATGAAPRRLSIPGAGPRSVLHLRSFADALALRERLRGGARLAVVGGGFIGLEIAASAVERGCTVTLVEMAPRILTRGVPREIADEVLARHEAAGVTVRLGTGIARIEPRSDGEALILADGSEIACDAVVAGIGAVPETGLAERSGLAVDNGVAVDATLRTADPDIYAAGDCCSCPHPLYGGRRLRFEAWRNAQDQGTLAARNMLGADEPYAAVPWFWSDQYDRTLQVAGLVDEGRDTVERNLEGARLFFHLADAGRLVAVSGFGPNGLIAREVRLGEMMIARRVHPDPGKLRDPAVKLKSLLA